MILIKTVARYKDQPKSTTLLKKNQFKDTSQNIKAGKKSLYLGLGIQSFS